MDCNGESSKVTNLYLQQLQEKKELYVSSRLKEKLSRYRIFQETTLREGIQDYETGEV